MLNKKNYINTEIGGIFSLFTFSFILLFSWLSAKDVILKKEPRFYMQKQVEESSASLNLTKYHFPVSFGLFAGQNTPILDPSYFNIRAFNLRYEYNLEYHMYELANMEEYKTKYCEYSDFPALRHKDFDKANLKNTLCLKEENYSLSLKGFWNDANVAYFKLFLESCKNNTSSDIKCKTPSEIKDYISAASAVYFSINFLDTELMLEDKIFTKSFNKYLVREFNKETTFRLQRNIVSTDTGLIFSSYEKKEFYNIFEQASDIRPLEEHQNNTEFLTFEIFISDISQICFRSYIKFPELLAWLGGLIMVFSSLFFYLNKIFSKVEKNISLINEIFLINENQLNDNFSRYETLKNEMLYNNYKSNVTNKVNKISNNLKINPNPIPPTNSTNKYNNICFIKNSNNFDENFKCNLDNRMNYQNRCLKDNYIKQDNLKQNHYNSSTYIKNNDNSGNNSNNGNFLNNKKISGNDCHSRNINDLNNDKSIPETVSYVENNNLDSSNHVKNSNDYNNYNTNQKENAGYRIKVPYEKIHAVSNQVLKTKNIQSHKSKNFIDFEINKNNLSNTENDNLSYLKSYVQVTKEDHNNSQKKLSSSIVQEYLNLGKPKRTINFSLCDKINICLKYSSGRKISLILKKKLNIYKGAKLWLDNYFDYIFLIKKFEEINILKQCLLNKTQNKIFEMLSTPAMSHIESFIRTNTNYKSKFINLMSTDIKYFMNNCDNTKNTIDLTFIKIMKERLK